MNWHWWKSTAWKLPHDENGVAHVRMIIPAWMQAYAANRSARAWREALALGLIDDPNGN